MSYSCTCVLPSALKCLTSVFGMGTGVSTSPSSPDFLSKLDILISLFLAKLSPRPISTGQLNTSQCLHTQPINLVFFKGSYSYDGKSHLVGGFTLRCFQRLSRPYLATQLWPWQANWCTIDTSIPVLSY